MGTSLLHKDRLFVQALLASLGLHFMLALFVPTLAWLQRAGPPIETISFVHVMRISVATAPPLAEPRAATAPRHSRVPKVETTQPQRARTPSRSAQRSMRTANVPASSAPVIAERSNESAAVGTNASAPPAPPPATPSEERVASVQNHNSVGGYMPFGADIPTPVLDPGALKALGTLNVHVTLSVVVDSNGHTKSVAFDPPLDPKIQDQIRSMLADASWDPAVCGGGVACEGRTTIKL
ncbi:MAG TPA: hypothetical protein VGN11_00610 [Candidatus Baltobacteraceae bacterium]|jgi:hypothetical protein|nr:hypothetical protein [Candidatus Baltobacteraceae bacterium]